MKELINELETIIKNVDDESFVTNFEKKLEEIYLTEDSKMIGYLIKLLDDKFLHDEIMFSIIHTIESFNDEIYVAEIIKSIPEFVLNSPRWASIIHMRIINSSDTLNAYIEEIKSSSSYDKKVLRLLLTSMSNKGKEIEVLVNPLLKSIDVA